MLSFDKFYDRFSKWFLVQEEISYDDVAAIQEEMKRKDELEEFAKKTDRIA